MTKVRDVVQAMERLAPPALALDGDPVGLHAGRMDDRVRRVAVALDASLAAIEEAAAKKADMLVVHHPRFYRGLSTLSGDDSSGRRADALLRRGLALYAAHTNYDAAEGGTNDTLAKLAGLRDPDIVSVTYRERLIKLAVFVPESHIKQVLRAVTRAGAGAIGKYSDCTFRSRGTGTFRGGDDAKPFIGAPGTLEEAEEYRLETIFGEHAQMCVLDALLAAHPYEEVAYDLYPLAVQGRAFGLGRAGDLAKPERLDDFARRLAAATGSPMTQFQGGPGRKVRRAAVWAGAGVEAKAFAHCGVDAVAAGEVSYHEHENFADAGIAVVTLGHGHSEAPAMPPLARRLGRLLPGCPVVMLRAGAAVVRNA